MSMRKISSRSILVIGSSLPVIFGGCDAANSGRVLVDGGLGNLGGGTSNGGQANVGGSSNASGVGGTGNRASTGGSPTVPFATGGTKNSSGTGGAPATGGSAAADGSYYVGGVWHGYFWDSATGTGSTITPANFTNHTLGAAFCASGIVGPMTDYSGVAMIGYNINQAQGTATTPGTWTPASVSSGGVTVNVTNNSTSVLRVQIQGPNGATVATDRWCATLTLFDRTVTIPWSSFNTACWDGTGTSYGGQPLQAVSVLVPGGNLSSVSYSFCINSISG
jgi:hypothetical protein